MADGKFTLDEDGKFYINGDGEFDICEECCEEPPITNICDADCRIILPEYAIVTVPDCSTTDPTYIEELCEEAAGTYGLYRWKDYTNYCQYEFGWPDGGKPCRCVQKAHGCYDYKVILRQWHSDYEPDPDFQEAWVQGHYTQGGTCSATGYCQAGFGDDLFYGNDDSQFDSWVCQAGGTIIGLSFDLDNDDCSTCDGCSVTIGGSLT